MELGIPSNRLRISWLSDKPDYISPVGIHSQSYQSQGGDSGLSKTVCFIILLVTSIVFDFTNFQNLHN